MESLNSILAFVRVVEAESFSGAARELSVPKSTLSRRISRLEKRLGAQLLVRTTRSLSLTEVGQEYYERCRRIVLDIEEAESAVRESSSTPRGRLRITMPVPNGNLTWAELLTGFALAYPEVEIEATSSQRFVHLVDEGYDLALRAGRLADSNLMARQLVASDHILVGTPGYFDEHGIPERFEDLREHQCIVRTETARWESRTGQVVTVSGRLRVNDIGVALHGCKAGLGLCIVPSAMVKPELDSGELQEVLADEMRFTTGIYAVYPPGRQLSAKVRAFIDYAVEYFKDAEDAFLPGKSV